MTDNQNLKDAIDRIAAGLPAGYISTTLDTDISYLTDADRAELAAQFPDYNVIIKYNAEIESYTLDLQAK